MGFGGKLEPGETVEHAAVRELAEETGLTLDQKQLSKVGLLLFTFECQPNLFLEVHVYETFAIRTLPTLCDEFFPPPTWFKEEDVPKQVRKKIACSPRMLSSHVAVPAFQVANPPVLFDSNNSFRFSLCGRILRSGHTCCFKESVSALESRIATCPI